MSDAPVPPPVPEPAHEPKPVFDPQLFPPRHRPLRQWFLDHNPCLLLSTVLMLLGCYLVSSALHDQSDLAKIAGLLGVINVYEACIIPLGLVLIRRTRGTARDGWWLILFEALFIVNGTFINVDFRSAWSIPFNLILFLLALIKVAVIFRGLKIGLSLRTFGFFALQLALIYGMPILFAQVNVDGVVSERVMYGLWWAVGLLPVVYDQLARLDERRHPANPAAPRWDLVQQVIRRVYLMVPWVMLVAHLRFAHWAHNSDFQFADLSPVLLGLAVASLRLRLNSQARVWARALPAFALLLAFGSDHNLSWMLDAAREGTTILPLHITLAAMVLTYGYMAGPLQLACAAASLVLAALGYFLHARVIVALRAVAQFVADMFPATAYGWGIAAIAGAFMLLGVGSLLGLRRTAARPHVIPRP